MRILTFPELHREVREHHAAEARPVSLTPRGAAVAAGRRFVRDLRALPSDDRAEILAGFASDLRDVIAELAYGA